MTEHLVPTRGAQLCVQTFGAPDDPALLLIHGATASMDWWDAGFCELLARGGRFVIRYDHRDTGRSTPSPAGRPGYAAADLTADPLRILDALGIARAHVLGVSMGGGIAQELAALHAERILTVTLAATSPAGSDVDRSELPPPLARVAATLDDPAPAPAWDDVAEAVDHLVEAQRPYAGSDLWDEDRVRSIARDVVTRTRDLEASVTNHWLVAGDGTPFRLAEIAMPVLVLHGTDDPLFPPAHGEALAAAIPGARLVRLEGMGHESPPPALWDAVVPEVLRHTSPPDAA